MLREDLWKLVGLVAFLSAGLAGHYDKLPHGLEPYKDWIEFSGFVATLLIAWRMQPTRFTPAPTAPAKAPPRPRLKPVPRRPSGSTGE